MNRNIFGTAASLALLAASSNLAVADSHGEKGIKAFRACYATATEGHVVGAPSLEIKVVVDEMPSRKAEGEGTVTWASVGPAFKPFTSPIKGPWYFMCTMTSCSIRFDFSSAPGAKGLKGMLVADNWGAPGVFKYEFEGGPGVVTQKAAVCN